MPSRPPRQPCHDCLDPITWLEGRWVTKDGRGSYPNTPSFRYHEEIDIIYAPNEPLLAFMALAKHFDKPLIHQERAYFTMQGPRRIQFATTRNIGYMTFEVGRRKRNLKQVRLKSQHIVTMSHVEPPFMRKSIRTFTLLRPDTLEYVFCKQTDNTRMTEYLRGVYKKVE